MAKKRVKNELLSPYMNHGGGSIKNIYSFHMLYMKMSFYNNEGFKKKKVNEIKIIKRGRRVWESSATTDISTRLPEQVLHGACHTFL